MSASPERLSPDGYRCDRCDVECERWRWNADHPTGEWYVCPCCRSRIRTAAQIEAAASDEAQRLGLSLEDYAAQVDAKAASFHPVSESEMRRIAARFAEMASEWEPACEHDTVNPYLPAPASGEEPEA